MEGLNMKKFLKCEMCFRIAEKPQKENIIDGFALFYYRKGKYINNGLFLFLWKNYALPANNRIFRTLSVIKEYFSKRNKKTFWKEISEYPLKRIEYIMMMFTSEYNLLWMLKNQIIFCHGKYLTFSVDGSELQTEGFKTEYKYLSTQGKISFLPLLGGEKAKLFSSMYMCDKILQKL